MDINYEIKKMVKRKLKEVWDGKNVTEMLTELADARNRATEGTVQYVIFRKAFLILNHHLRKSLLMTNFDKEIEEKTA